MPNPWSTELEESAEKFSRSAMHALLDDDPAVFLIHAATGLEHLTKGFLASIHGSLIAAADLDSLLHACGAGQHSKKLRGQTKTISVGEAFTRASVLIPQLANLKPSLTTFVEARNGAIHAAHVDEAGMEDAVIGFLRVVEIVLAATERPQADFWSDLLPAVRSRLADSIEAATVRATDKIVAARIAFAAKFGSLDQEAHDAVVLTIEKSYVTEGYDEDLIACPACETLALAHGTHDVDWEADWDYSDGETYLAGVFPTVTFYPGRLQCRGCGLALDGDAELKAAGVPKSWHFENVDRRDFESVDWDEI